VHPLLQEADPIERHPVDIVSGTLGLLAVTLGVLVIAGSIRDYDHRGGWWLAIAGIVVAVAIVPWRGARVTTAEQAQAGPSRPERDTDSTVSEF
jgi:hypothetical protein